MDDHLIKNKDFSPLAAFFTTLLCVVFGANAVAIKISLSGFGVFTTAGLRFLIASVAIFLWVLATGRRLCINKEQVLKLLIVSGIFILQMTLLYNGLNKTTASRG